MYHDQGEVMNTTTQLRWGPEITPSHIQRLILITCMVTIISALIDTPISHLFGIPGPQDLFSLSWYGINHYFFWQPISYMFVQYNGGQGITLFFLLILIFNMYMLWILGSIIYDHIGPKSFFCL